MLLISRFFGNYSGSFPDIPASFVTNMTELTPQSDKSVNLV